MSLLTKIARTLNAITDRHVNQWKDLLNMVTTNEEEQQEILSHFFAFLHESMQDEPGYDGSLANVDVSLKTLTAAYFVIRTDLFIKAWTYAISVYNYRKAVKEIKRDSLDYIR